MVERLRRKAPLIFRIHQGGDFYSKAYFERWCAICAACPGTMFYAFTKAYPYLRLERPPNFALLVSVYYDERRRRPQGAPAFYTVRRSEVGPGIRCVGRCEQCGICPAADAQTTVWTVEH